MKNSLLFLLLTFLISCSDSDDSGEVYTENVFVADTHYFKGELEGYDHNIDLEHVVYNQRPQLEENYHKNHYFFLTSSVIAPRTEGQLSGEGKVYCVESYYSSSIGSKFGSIGYSEEHDYLELTLEDFVVGECLIENEFEALKSFFEKDNFEFTRNFTARAEFSPANSVNIRYVPGNEDQVYLSSSGDNTDAQFKITNFNYRPNGTHDLDYVSNKSYSYEFEVYGEVTCKLYKLYDDSEFIQLNNGKFKLVFRTLF